MSKKSHRLNITNSDVDIRVVDRNKINSMELYSSAAFIAMNNLSTSGKDPPGNL